MKLSHILAGIALTATTGCLSDVKMKDATVEVKDITTDQTDYVSIYVDSLPRYRNAIGDTLSFDEVFCTLESQGDIRGGSIPYQEYIEHGQPFSDPHQDGFPFTTTIDSIHENAMQGVIMHVRNDAERNENDTL